MSFFPTTRIGRALVIAAVVSGVAVVLPFLVAVVKMTGDVTTELPPLEPEGTLTAVLLANPVAWFLVVTSASWLVLAITDVVRHLRRPRPPARATTRRPPARKPAARTSPQRRPAARPVARTATRAPARPRTQQKRPASRR